MHVLKLHTRRWPRFQHVLDFYWGDPDGVALWLGCLRGPAWPSFTLRIGRRRLLTLWWPSWPKSGPRLKAHAYQPREGRL